MALCFLLMASKSRGGGRLNVPVVVVFWALPLGDDVDEDPDVDGPAPADEAVTTPDGGNGVDPAAIAPCKCGNGEG